MRSVDCAAIVNGISTYEGKYYLRSTNKLGRAQLHAIGARVVSHLRVYLNRNKLHPCPYLFRHEGKPGKALGAQRLAKLALNQMGLLGIDTDTWKGHSLRGATATALLRKGVDRRWVQNRGGWTSAVSLDIYYNRLHQEVDWEEKLGLEENAGGRQSEVRLELATKKASEKASFCEADSLAFKGHSASLISPLTVQGLIRDLFCGLTCPACARPLRHEAAHCCRGCQSMYHVRCLPLEDPDTVYTGALTIRSAPSPRD
jgi:hypothetical protein